MCIFYTGAPHAKFAFALLYSDINFFLNVTEGVSLRCAIQGIEWLMQ